jgi:Nickel responsive protein SCO4226-like
VPKYVIERTMPAIGASTRDELHAAAARSCDALERLGPDIQWVHSYVTGDKIYCVYIAVNEELIRDHAEGAGLPADRISEVRALIDPTMASAAVAASA